MMTDHGKDRIKQLIDFTDLMVEALDQEGQMSILTTMKMSTIDLAVVGGKADSADETVTMIARMIPNMTL